MTQRSDKTLLDQHQEGVTDAFAELVRRHINWVYSAVKRRVGSPELAEDVTQTVFFTLAKSPPSRLTSPTLSPWLFGVLIRTCKGALRAQAVRRRHESEAGKMRPTTTPDPQADWNSIAPNLEDAVARLRFADQQAILLRFYEQLSFAEVGQTLGITEEAARKRVSRATEQLRRAFSSKGVSIPTVALAALLTAETVSPAPAAVAASAASGTASATVSSFWVGSLLMPAYPKVLAAAVLAILFIGGIALFSQLSGDRHAARAESSAPVQVQSPSTQPTTQPQDEVIARLEQIAKGFEANSIRSQDWWFKGRIFVEQRSAPGFTAPQSYLSEPEWRAFSYVQKKGKRRFEIDNSEPGKRTTTLKNESAWIQFNPLGQGLLEIYPALDEARWSRLISSYNEFTDFDFDRRGTGEDVAGGARALISQAQNGMFDQSRRLNVSVDNNGIFTIRINDPLNLNVFKFDRNRGFHLIQRSTAHHTAKVNIDLSEQREFQQAQTGHWVLISASLNVTHNSVAGTRRIVVDDFKIGQFEYPDQMFEPASLAIPRFVNTYDHRFTPQREFNNPHAHEQVSTELLLKSVVKSSDTSAIFGLTEDMKEEPMDEDTARALQEFMDREKP